MSLSAWEIALVVLIFVLIFGAKKIPELARSLGRASQEYKKAKEDFLKEVNQPAEDVKDAVESDKSAPAVAAAEEDGKDSGSVQS